ncbi:MAG: glycosyltransferase family 2 protein [Acidobacteria bacterium]|nr:glycosyltransferase family 2 protein [Acidobacteriota bacterium]
MAEAIFWISFVTVFYVYCGYPLLLLLWRWMIRKPVYKADWEPFVSVVIAAHNEREHLDAKIRNCLELDYPRDKLEIIVSLDGPTDGTEDVARRYEGKEVTVIHRPVHAGKAAALNRALAAARGEVIVFADARQQINPPAVRELVAALHDPSVGVVSGELILLDGTSQGAGEASDAVGMYWRYEKWIRAMESDIHSVVGATGALYAIRREFFTPLPDHTILDDVLIPMRIVLLGKRVVFEPSARAYDLVACCPEVEFGRKVRTLAGNYQLLTQLPELLFPWRNPVFLQFVSHKVGRLLVPYFLAALFLANCFLLQGFYLVLFGLQVAWYLSAFAGRLALQSRSMNHVAKPFVFGHR